MKKEKIKKLIYEFWNYFFEPADVEVQEEEVPKISDGIIREKINLNNPPDTYSKNCFSIHFPGIPREYFHSYEYLGTDVHIDKKWWHINKKTIKDDYSVFGIRLFVDYMNTDICEVLKNLELHPFVGDIHVNILDVHGKILKTITIPESQVSEIIAFREFDKLSDQVLFGKIIVKHKQRKLN